MTDDLLRGAAAIARYIQRTESQTIYLCAKGTIPAWKAGGRWESRKSTIERFYAEREARALKRSREREEAGTAA
jgi:hypothetical protein